MKKINKAVVIDWIKTIVYPVVLALIVLMIIRPTVVKEYSMYPTIKENDYVIVYKLAYKLGGEPEYHDVVVFESDLYLDETHNKMLIKRVIGAPGDTLRIEDGAVYLNGTLLEEDYINPNDSRTNMEEFTVPEGKLFVMGDNRNNSVDSRDERVGFVDMDRVMGKVVFRLYPFNSIGLL